MELALTTVYVLLLILIYLLQFISDSNELLIDICRIAVVVTEYNAQ